MRVPVLLVLLSGCQGSPDGGFDLYICDALPTLALRDPQTGECATLGHLGDECKECGNCAPDHVDAMGRADCSTTAFCESLSETSCLKQPGCRTVYALDDGHFLGCWGMPPSGAGAGAGDGRPCAGLDAYACSDDKYCAAWYVTDRGQAMAFDHCGDAPARADCVWAECDADHHCVQDCPPCDASGGASCADCQATCVPDLGCGEIACPLGTVCHDSCRAARLDSPGLCFASCQLFDAGLPGVCDGAITCAAGPPVCPAGTVAGRASGCYTGYCIPTTACPGGSPGTCAQGRASSTAPACPAGTVAGTTASDYTGYCIPLAACGSSPLGTCEPAADPATPPVCADGSIPGTIDGRYTGACIPANQCPLLTCDALLTEPGCAARADCRAIDRGRDCSCGPIACSCAIRQFDHCETTAGVDG